MVIKMVLMRDLIEFEAIQWYLLMLVKIRMTFMIKYSNKTSMVKHENIFDSNAKKIDFFIIFFHPYLNKIPFTSEGNLYIYIFHHFNELTL